MWRMDRGTASPTWQDLRSAIHARLEDDVATERAAADALRVEVVPRVRAAVVAARTDGRCERAWLFGSFAWDFPDERSDVDLLVERCDDTFGLASFVARACGRDVHVIDVETAPASLRDRVLRDGHPL